MTLWHTLVFAFLVTLTSLSKSEEITDVKTTEHYNQSQVLDAKGNYLLFWKYNDTHVTFEVHVKTRGWVGFGISNNGKMFPADIVIGWIAPDRIKTHFADRHTTEHKMPEIDQHQDWILLYSEANDFGTVLKFARKTNTCDEAEDKVIHDGTTRIIFAYSNSVPESDDVIEYHDQSKGTKSIALFNTNWVPNSLPSDVILYDFLNNNYLIPNASTTYWCSSFLMADIGKHHMIKYEPVITPGNELTVHHIILYRCRVQDPETSAGKSWFCYKNRPADLPECVDVFLAWTIGGKEFYFQEDVGFPVGDPRESSFYVMETHYDNSNRRSGVFDNSGLRMTLTKTLRTHDAGLLMTGQSVGRHQVIPPREKAFISKGYCSADCLNKTMTYDGVPKINVFATTQHAHLLGTAIKTRLIRDGTELEPLVYEPSYDFNFQETRILNKERVLYPGGLSTVQEMCLSFIYYYPQLSVSKCTSAQTLMPTIPDWREMSRLYNKFDWDNKTAVTELMDLQQISLVQHSCIGDDLNLPANELITSFVEKEPDTPYVPPNPECQ